MPAALLALIPTLLATLMPVAADGVRGIFAWFTGSAGAQPQNVQEAIALKQAETAQLEALAKLDAPAGNISLWVADLRASFRYIGAALVIIPLPFIAVWATVVTTDQAYSLLEMYAGQIASPVWGFLFGERMRLSFKRGK